jgi:type II secretion system protein H
MTYRATRNSAAFTLIELIIVMVIICTALAIAAPSLSGWNRGSRLRDSSDQFLALTRWARTQAIANSQTYRLNVDSQTGHYWVTAQDGQEFAAVASDFGQEFIVPDGAAIEVKGAESKALEFLTFYPTGRTTPAHVILSDERGAIEILCETPAEGFRILKPGETVQQ